MNITDSIYGRTALACAIAGEETAKALRMIENCDDIDQADKQGYTYLHFAAQMELPEVVDALLKKGASVEARKRSGGTPLRLAVVRCKAYPLERSFRVIKALLEHGADPNDVVNGVSVRELAGSTQLPEIISLLP